MAIIDIWYWQFVLPFKFNCWYQ